MAVINRRLSSAGNEEFLIQWKDLPITEATWVDKASFQNQFPNINLEDKICFDDIGNVTQLDLNSKGKGPATDIGSSSKLKRI
ncbi:hypothetical protein A2U01_0073920, partial [Trifolium medium]|nr:hypothetical protein [Trifolium medium]